MNQPVIRAVKDLCFPVGLIRVGADDPGFAVEHRVADLAGRHGELIKFVGLTGRRKEYFHRIGGPQTGRIVRLAEFVHLVFFAEDSQIEVVRIRSGLEGGLCGRFGFAGSPDNMEIGLFGHGFPAAGVGITVQRQGRFHDFDLGRNQARRTQQERGQGCFKHDGFFLSGTDPEFI